MTDNALLLDISLFDIYMQVASCIHCVIIGKRGVILSLTNLSMKYNDGCIDKGSIHSL